ncbi:hypothetical protein J5N97_009957 [Dioscorea zingiberensis]|uniref:SMP domain-containing protein n=1 Tax=Dioscorea zingiberensis TaxID=325984 RepID=A0A9D5CZS0_9LILI|nr:hypothetical protein J5N97_009957 [Dioscorea zingiberensis]
MSQEQPRRPQEQSSPIRYGDVFDVSGSLSSQAVAPQDAAMMQSAENLTTGQTILGGAASIMQSAANRNERAGHVTHDDVSNAAADQGVSVTQSDLPGRQVITETVAGQVVEQYVRPEPVSATAPSGALQKEAISIGEALEAAAMTAGNKPMTLSDAAAIQAAEAIITGGSVPTPGGVAAEAQSAAAANELVTRVEYKTKLSDVLSDATMKLSGDRAVTKEDAERVIGAELRNSPEGMTRPGGVAESVTAAARINQERQHVWSAMDLYPLVLLEKQGSNLCVSKENERQVRKEKNVTAASKGKGKTSIAATMTTSTRVDRVDIRPTKKKEKTQLAIAANDMEKSIHIDPIGQDQHGPIATGIESKQVDNVESGPTKKKEMAQGPVVVAAKS